MESIAARLMSSVAGSPSCRPAANSRCSGAAVLVAAFWVWAAHPPPAVGLPQGLTPDEMEAAGGVLKAALAGPREKAFLQIITDVALVRDDTFDTTFVYDLVVRYDPERFRDRHLGLYPLTFEDQFILWGKRIGLYTRSTTWTGGRFYLHDVSNGRQAWIYAHDARMLYPTSNTQFPAPTSPDNKGAVKRWLRLFHGADKTTDLSSMTMWLRLMHRESRDLVLQRMAAAAAADSIAAAAAASAVGSGK